MAFATHGTFCDFFSAAAGFHSFFDWLMRPAIVAPGKDGGCSRTIVVPLP